jgi:hypothetical protein
MAHHEQGGVTMEEWKKKLREAVNEDGTMKSFSVSGVSIAEFCDELQLIEKELRLKKVKG